MARKPAAPAARQSIGIRPRTELKQQLEKIAAENGRSLAQEVERRLEQSLEEKPEKVRDPLPGIFTDEIRRALRGSPAFAQIVEAVADTLFQTIRAANEKGRDEIEVRTAARAALNAVADNYLWRGEEKETPVEAPLAPLGTRLLDYPPAHMGYSMALQRIAWLSLWRDGDAAADKAEGRICDIYSGTGRTVLMGPTADDVKSARESASASARAGLASGEVEYEDQSQLHRYVPVRADPPQKDLGEDAPPQSLKDIMGR